MNAWDRDEASAAARRLVDLCDRALDCRLLVEKDWRDLHYRDT